MPLQDNEYNADKQIQYKMVLVNIAHVYMKNLEPQNLTTYNEVKI